MDRAKKPIPAGPVTRMVITCERLMRGGRLIEDQAVDYTARKAVHDFGLLGEYCRPLKPPASFKIELMNADQLMDRHFLEVRAKLLEVAATLDRFDRADLSQIKDDPRLQQLRQGMEILLQDDGANRAEQIQQLFSREYDPQWRQSFGI